MLTRIVYLRFMYYIKKIIKFFGFCPKCGTFLNYTIKGRALCPKCGR